jgi:small Trp-rich protein
MAFMILGIALLAMKLAEIGPVAEWSWLWVLAPFGMAVLWWGVADKMGLTQRRAMDKMEAKKTERRNRNLEALGLEPLHARKARRDSRFPAGAADKHVLRDPTAADDASPRR